MNTVITLVAVAFLGQAEPIKTYPGAPGAYGQCKEDAVRLRTTQHKVPSEYMYRYRCNIKWKDITDPTEEPGFKGCMGRWFDMKKICNTGALINCQPYFEQLSKCNSKSKEKLSKNG
jgi:hypothetical protein